MYTLIRFEDVVLPLFDRNMDLDTAPQRQNDIQTIAGGFDIYGSGRAMPQIPYTLQMECTLHEVTIEAMRTGLDILRGMSRGKYKLWRRADDDHEFQWAWARLVRIKQRRKPGEKWWVNLNMEFQVWSTWNGSDHDGWLLNDGNYLNDGLYLNEGSFEETMPSSPHDIVVTNGGNDTVYDVVITVTVGASAMSGLLIYTDADPRCAYSYSTSMASGAVLVIDTGAVTAKVNGTNVYGVSPLFNLHTSLHDSEHWMELPPGDTTIYLQFTGGSTDSTVNVSFTDKHS